MIRHHSRSRMMLFAVAMACALSAATAATATEYTAAPSWKAPPAQAAPVAFAQVEKAPTVAAPSGGRMLLVAGAGTVFVLLLKASAHKSMRPREKPRLWA